MKMTIRNNKRMADQRFNSTGFENMRENGLKFMQNIRI